MVAGRPSPAPLGPVYPAGSALGGGWGLLWPYRTRVFRWCLHAVAALQAALFESARDDMRRAHLAAQAMQLRRQVADDETVDQFIRHAESGFFGGEDPDFEWRVGDY